MKQVLIILLVIFSCNEINAEQFQRSHASQLYWTWRPDIADSCYEFTFENYFPVSTNPLLPQLHWPTICLVYWNECNYGKNYIGVSSTPPYALNQPLHDTLYRITSHYGIRDTFCGYDSPYQEGNVINFCQVDAPHRKKLVYRGLIYLPEKCSNWYFAIGEVNNICADGFSHICHTYTNGKGSGYTNTKSNLDSAFYSVWHDSIRFGAINSYGIFGCTMNNLNFPNNSSPRFLSSPLYCFQTEKGVEYNPAYLDPDQDSIVISIADTIKSAHLMLNFTTSTAGLLAFGRPFFGKTNYLGVPIDEVLTYNMFLGPLPGSTGPNPPRFNAHNNPFDTDSTFHLVDSTGKTTFTAKSDMEPILYYRARNYVKGILKSENYFIQPFVLINENREPSYHKLDTATIQGVQFNSHGTMKGCATVPISFEAYVKLPIIGGDLIVRTTADTTLPGNGACTILGNHTDSVRLQFTWTPPANARGLYNVFVSAKDSNCTPPYNHYTQVYTWSFYIDSCAFPLSVASEFLEEDIIYPNPANHTLHFRSDKFGLLDYTIMNATGQLITEGKQKKKYGADATFDITTLPKGVYFLRTKLENKIKVYRFVKE